MIDDKLSENSLPQQLTISAADGKTLSWLHANAQICAKELIEDKIRLNIKISPSKWAQLKSRLPLLN